jgi:plasmid stabilization system protein ParE
MKVAWTNKAKKDRDNIADYIREGFGAKRKDEFLLQVRQTTKMLKRYPNMGPIDPLFADRPRSYRSVIVGGLSKMVYFVEGDVVYIASMWDCRRDPEVQAAEVAQ